jgi:MerR family transcriptional regulator, thiopeptide resistance regulator
VNKLYHVREFAKLAGVTVRALHHYDRMGLLKPGRTEAGYRLYYLRDLERLEQIVALKLLGVPLKQIRLIFQRSTSEMSSALQMQRRVLEEKRRLLDSAIRAIEEAEKATAPGKRPDSAILKKIIEVIEMQDNMDWSKKYYSEGAQAKIEERKKLWSPENQERWSKEWSDLFRDVEAALGEDPAGGKAQALAARWKKLVEGFTGGDPQITAGLSNMYQDRPNWPASMQQRMQPFSNKKVWEFIQRAFAAGKTTS